MMIVIISGVWGMINCKSRKREESYGGRIVDIGNGLIYIMMIEVKKVEMMRYYKRGRGL